MILESKTYSIPCIINPEFVCPLACSLNQMSANIFDSAMDHFGTTPQEETTRLISERNLPENRQFRQAIYRVLNQRGQLRQCSQQRITIAAS